MTHFSDDLYLGDAKLTPTPEGDQPPGGFGVGPLGRVYLWDAGTPAAPAVNNVALAQTLGGAANLVLTAGAGVTAVKNARGESVLQLDVPRGLQLVGVAGTGAQSYTITGYDRYGQKMSQTVAHAGGATAAATLKAFWQILSVAAAGATVNTISVGTTDVLGLPVRVDGVNYIIARESGVAFQTIPTPTAFVGAVTTNPATPATGDVRGTYDPQTVMNGAVRVTAFIFLPAAASGPNATRLGAYGVDQDLAAQ